MMTQVSSCEGASGAALSHFGAREIIGYAMDEEFELGPEARRTILAGKVIFNNLNSVFDCVVTELSPLGARIKVASPFGIPRLFHLEVRDLGKRFVCEVRSRGLKEILVGFDQGVKAWQRAVAGRHTSL
jgi:hypothetical protein